MFVKYISENNFDIGLYISLAGFGQSFITEGREDLNTVIGKITISLEERKKFVDLVKDRYSIYSNDDHIVPFKILEEYPKEINSNAMLIEGIGHMGKKSGLESLPQVIEIINNMEV